MGWERRFARCHMVTSGFRHFVVTGQVVLAVSCKSLIYILNNCGRSFEMKTVFLVLKTNIPPENSC